MMIFNKLKNSFVSAGKKFPNSAKPPVKTPDGFVFLDPANFATDFTADLPREQAEFMAHSRILTARLADSH